MKALIVIDLQQGLIKSKNFKEILKNTEEVIKKFKISGHKIILIKHISQDKESMFNELNDDSNIYSNFEPYMDVLIKKETPSAFFNTGLDSYLKEHKIEELYILGLNSEYCVSFTSIAAFDRGYKTFIVEDLIDTVNSGKVYGYKSIDVTDYTLTVLYNSGVINLVESKDL